jgi:hypothetical protein
MLVRVPPPPYQASSKPVPYDQRPASSWRLERYYSGIVD